MAGKPRTRVMYIENRSDPNARPWIGRVTFAKTGQSLTYAGRRFQKLGGPGFKANYFEVETGDHFWIAGPRKDGADRPYPQSAAPIVVDDDAADEYWTQIRGMAALMNA